MWTLGMESQSHKYKIKVISTVQNYQHLQEKKYITVKQSSNGYLNQYLTISSFEVNLMAVCMKGELMTQAGIINKYIVTFIKKYVTINPVRGTGNSASCILL